MKKIFFLIMIVFVRNPFKLGNILETPSINHILGTDNLGRDIFSRLILGTFNTMLIVIISISIATIIGITIASIAAYYGGLIDGFIQTIIEIFLAIPSILLSILIVVLIDNAYFSLLIAIIVSYLPSIINYTRAVVLKEKTKDYVIAAKTYGVSNMRIIFKHMFLNIKPYLLLNYEINLSKAILTEASLGFLGIGLDPSIPTLGNMLNSSQTYFLIAPWFVLAPGLTIIFLVYKINKIAKKKDNNNAKKLEINNLNIYIDDEHLLKNININIKENEIVAILGESGSGKTLTTKYILSILPEKSIIKVDSFRNDFKMGAIFQNAFTLFNQTIKISKQLKHLYLSHYNNLDNYDEKIRYLFTKVGLNYDDFINKYPYETSGGQRQRIAIAAALISKPDLLIADEITTSLDEENKNEVIKLLKSLNISILFITHEINVLKSFANRVYVMYNGEILEENNIEDIFKNPKEIYTKKLIELSEKYR